MEYEKLLDKAYEKVKKNDSARERFEIPKIDGHFEGNKTILANFYQIASNLRRDVDHFKKFMLKELAASGQRDGDRMVLNRKVIREKIDNKIEEYVKEYILCRECKKPDTELVKKGRINFIKCLACGAKHSVKGI